MELNFYIEKRAGIWVKQWVPPAQGCRPATEEEVIMWKMLAGKVR
jgi:hypothetical protein